MRLSTTSTARTGATGFAISPDHNTQQQPLRKRPDSEDGGSVIGIVDLATNKVIRQVQQAYGKAWIPMSGLARYRMPRPIRRSAAFAGTNGITFSPLGGGTLSLPMAAPTMLRVISLQKALAGTPVPSGLESPCKPVASVSRRARTASWWRSHRARIWALTTGEHDLHHQCRKALDRSRTCRSGSLAAGH